MSRQTVDTITLFKATLQKVLIGIYMHLFTWAQEVAYENVNVGHFKPLNQRFSGEVVL